MDGIRSALIIASDQYTDSRLRQLRAPASDARALATVLRDPGIGNFEVRTLLNEPAHVISLAVEEFFADRQPADLLLVHFSGHGIKDQDGELYFAAPNTVLGRLGATAVAAEFVSRRMSRSRSRRVVLLLDCCYAGAFERGLVARASSEVGIEQQFGGRGRAVITASSAMEYAFEAGELTDTSDAPPSVFTSALVQGLETGDADRDLDGLVGLDELYDYIYDRVRAVTPSQTPGKWTFGMEGELHIARRSRPVITPAVLPSELRQAIDSPLAGVRAGAVQELAGVLRGRHPGKVLAARLALEQLAHDDSRAVATAAVVALHAQVSPALELSATSIDFGPLPRHGQSQERRIQLRNTGSGSLNARATTSASWLKLRQTGDELMVAAEAGEDGQYEGTVTVESDGGTATIHVRAQVLPTPLPPGTATANAPAEAVPDASTGDGSHLPPDPVLAAASSAVALAVPPVTENAPAPANLATGQPTAGLNEGPGSTAHGGGWSHLGEMAQWPSARPWAVQGNTAEQITPRERVWRSRFRHFGSVKTAIAVAVVIAAGGAALAAGLTWLGSPRVALPAVTGVSPASGTTAGGSTVAITGAGLGGATSVSFGGVAAKIISDSSTQIIASSPPGIRIGTVDITVTTPVGTSAATVGDRFTYTATTGPHVTRLSPASGPTSGGTRVTITGTGLEGATSVRFGAAGAAVTADSSTRITATSPPGTGAVDITVTTPAGTSAVTPSDKFTYKPTQPTVTGTPSNGGSTGGGSTGGGSTGGGSMVAITGVSPHSGPAAGGTPVTITGTNLSGATGVSFGGRGGTITADSSTQITATSPAGSGTVNITVTTPAGTSAATVSDEFTYAVPAPTVTGVRPSSGSGGTTVYILGTNLSGATSVSFGGAVATITSDSSTEIGVTAPSGSGTVNVTVTTAGGTSVITSADYFTYVEPIQ